MVFVVLASSLVAQSQYATNPKRSANSSTIKVWVNTDSGVYDCPGARWYGKTKAGAFMEQREAQQKGYKPASGKICGFASASSTSQNEAIQNSLGAQCGFERWPVKVLTDRDRALVDFKPTDTTVAALNNLKRHNTHPYDRRVKDEELRVYRVRARLVEMHDEADSDLHLVIAEPDQPDVSMLAVIPASFCALGSGHESDYETARAYARGIAVGSLIEIAGVGFFDTIHSQTGVARNGFELHPVLRIRALQAP
jgi:hypothetical protein